MTPREQDLLRIRGGYNNSAGDLDRIGRGLLSASTVWYGERLSIPNDSKWYDAISSMMQSLHETSISSLNDDNRNDEKEIELLEEASNITDQDLKNLQDLINFYDLQYKDAVSQSNTALASHYKELKRLANWEYITKEGTIKKADDLVRSDKSLFSSHNPIIELIGDIFDTTTTGASIGAGTGSAAGSVIPAAGTTAGAAIGGIVGAIAGFGYGIYDHFDSGRNHINAIAYTSPESENRFENYKNSITTRLSYKDVRAKLILEDQDALFYWKTEYPVSDYYRSIEQAGTGNYLYYNLPGIVGSSVSDTKDMGQQITTAVGLNKLANKIPNSKLRSVVRAAGFLSALRNGWQQSLNENHAEASETAVKKAIGEIKKNGALKEEMISNAKNVAVKLYGLDSKDADTLIDEEVAFTMYLGGIGGLNPRKLQNSYDYYKSARQLGDAGADTQFERDMVATAGGDVLEAALMVTPYGALAKKSKLIGRAVAGAAVGAATGEFLGFGVGGSVIGGGVGALAAQNRFARRLWRNQMHKILAIEDKILPRLEHQIMFDKGLHAASAFGVTALAEAAEEGTQYLNSLDAEKILNEADDKINLRDMKNLFVNDLKKRGEVFNAVLSLFGLTDSPYQTDQEFWSNWKGGLILGGLMTGAIVSASEGIGAKKAYNAAKFLQDEILSSAVANRVASLDAILKGAAFAKHGLNNDGSSVFEIIERAKNKNKNRTDTGYSDKDFDDLLLQANRIISRINHKTFQKRLTDLGYELGSDEANIAIAVDDYYRQKTTENGIEELKEYGEKIKWINDPNVIEALNILSGEETGVADDFGGADTNSFTFKIRGKDGNIEERSITNRERLLRLHLNAAELIAITQLLKDLLDIQVIKEFAKSKGIAFSRNLIDSTISLLKDKYNLLKNDVLMYANELFDSLTTTYDLQIEHLKGYLLDQNAGMKLSDLYRNSILRMVNQRVYTNIIKSLAISTDFDAKNKDVLDTSKNMAKMFEDNINKNKQLLEILDYNIENDFENSQPSLQERLSGTVDSSLNSEEAEATPTEVDVLTNELENDEQNVSEKKPSLFQRIMDRINKFFSEDEDTFKENSEDILDTGEDEDSTVPSEEGLIDESQLVETNPEELLQQQNGKKDETQEEKPQVSENEGIDDQLAVIPEDVSSVALPQDPQEQVDATVPAANDDNAEIIPDDSDNNIEVFPSDSENAVIVEDLESAVIVGDDDSDTEGLLLEDKQGETVNMLSVLPKDAPRKLIDGWYVTKDGKIIPSDKMYMMNPVETPYKLGQAFAQKYRSVAAQIRLTIHRFNLNKNNELQLKQYVAMTLKTADPVVVDTVAKAILNEDQNAVKLLIIHSNPRAWDSYYVNEFFRDAARRILNGQPVQRPQYIDKESFKKFCRLTLLYKHNMQSVYGFKFVTNIAPFVTKINGEDVVADPDFIAVDNAGNAHIVNIYTINNLSYKKRMANAEMYTIDLGNTNNLFSQDLERNILADIQIKAIRNSGNIQVSSASLLPVVVDGYTAIHRLYLGKLVPLSPTDENMSKYVNLEDLLLELKELLEQKVKEALQVIKDFNDTVEKLRKYRSESKRSGYKLEKRQFTPDKEPSSVAETYAQIDKLFEIIQSAQDYLAKHMEKEVSEMEAFYKELSKKDKKSEISKRIDEINEILDESWTTGILVEVLDGDLVINNSDIITNGVTKALLKTSPQGSKYVLFVVEYKGKTYALKIYRNRDKKYGKKNGDMFKQNEHSIFTDKRKQIEALLTEYPDLVLTFDIRRSFIKYAEDSSGSKPRGITETDGLLSEIDVENLGVLQNDGKIVDIGFYDKKTGVILTGQNSQSATLTHAPEGDWWLNQMFLVIKLKHLEEKTAQDRTVAIPLIKMKFSKQLATFIATCYRIIAETNHLAGYDSLKKRMLANQMLHLFISKRLVYKKGELELANIVYINGDSVRVNGNEFYILTKEGFLAFINELLNCEIMPSWDTFNAKFKNLASSAFSMLYDHFSTSQESLKINIDGIDSGLEITKDQFNNDTLCQWLVKNKFFASKTIVAREPIISIHNVKISNLAELQVKEDQKQNQQTVIESKPAEEERAKEEPIIMSEEEFNKLGLEEVTEDDEDDENAQYASPVIPTSGELSVVKKIKDLRGAINILKPQYPKLVKLFRIAMSKMGAPNINVTVSNLEGEWKVINGVRRLKQGSVKRNDEDGSYSIILYKNCENPFKTLAHEITHIFTLGAIEKNTNCAKAARVFYQYCKDVFAKDENKPYGLKSLEEFVAEYFTNEEFVQYLKEKAPMQEAVFAQATSYLGKVEKGRIKTLFDSIMSLITKMWLKYILRQQPSMYSQIYDVIAQIFGDAADYVKYEDSYADYSVENHVTHKKIKLQHCRDRNHLKGAVACIMSEWILHENITPLGKNIEKLKFSAKAIQERIEQDTEFAQWYQRTFTYSNNPLIRELTKITRPTKEDLKTQDNPEGYILYEKKVKTTIQIKKKDGSVVTKTVKMPKTFTTVNLDNWDVITPIVDEFMSDMRIETRKKVELRKEDEEMEQREDGRNTMGELLTESFEISPFDRASAEVKWMFSTVPYGTVVETEDKKLKWQRSTDHNEFGMSTFMPFRNVYGRVLYYTANCTNTKEILEKFYTLAHTGPDKAMFLYLYERLSDLIANRWKPEHLSGNKSNPTQNEDGLFFDANVDSVIIKVIRALRQQQNDFVWALAKDVVDKDKNKQKQIDIRTTLYQKKAIETTRSWMDLLSTGMSDVLKYDPETQTYKFKSGIKINVFKKIYSDLFAGSDSFIRAYNKLRKQDPEDVTLNWLYLENSGNIKFSEITSDDIKTYLHNALLHCGIDISEEILDQWLLQIMEDNPTIKTEMDALYAMLSDLHSNSRPSNFFARLANVGENGEQLDADITEDTIKIAFDSGFVKELANKQNEYDLRTQSLMTVASHNNQYYIVSERNYVNDIAQIINSHNEEDSYILMLEDDSFASGSSVLEWDKDKNRFRIKKGLKLSVATFVGMKTSNVGDLGRDYFEIELNEDIVSKLELLQEGFMLAPTTSDKKTYHAIQGIPLVGMQRGVRSNAQCYSVDYKTGQISIIDSQILDRFIAYFKSERDAVEKAIIAYETEFYKKYPGKKIVNYSDNNGLKFSSFCCLPLANGEKIYLNKDIDDNFTYVSSAKPSFPRSFSMGRHMYSKQFRDPRKNLSAADNNFFNKSIYEQRAIMQRILLARASEDLAKIEEVGLIKKNENGSYENIGLDGATILEMAERRVKATFGDKGRLADYTDESGKHAGPRKLFSISSAILEYCLDCTIKHLMSMQEYQRLFSGSKSFYKWRSKGGHVVDISVDYTKRRGGDISTGGVNVFDIDPIAGMEELGTYRCIEIEDYTVESTTLGQAALIELFESSLLAFAAASILSGDTSPLNTSSVYKNENFYKHKDTAEQIVYDKYYKEYVRYHRKDPDFKEKDAEDYAKDIIDTIKSKAKADAMQYFREISSKEDPINVADGATYITDRMCERLLREEGKWDDDMKYAFEVLRGEHGEDVLSKEGQKLYKSILNVIIGTLKYTATGFRKSDDGQGGTLMTPYYNKTALFPVFEQIAYGKMGLVLLAMRKNNVDVMMMTSAVKTGSQGAITIDLMLSDLSFSDHTYILEIRFLRKQLNTDPNEREEMNLGTQTIKIALSNLRMDDDYIDPFTGKTVKGHELYSTIMRCYNILTDIGYEQVMMRFAKKYPDGTPAYANSLPVVTDDEGNVLNLDTDVMSSIPVIDEEALSIFLHEELMSRDANDNMFDAITYDQENDTLAAPMSAISQSGWIDSILSSYISKTIIDTKSPGSAYIQRSVFCMEGNGPKILNDGEDLLLANKDGSMDAIISIDFFKDIIPDYENKTFEEARLWLILHKLIGENAKTYAISYRIPTQAQASINALKFVDVIPIVSDTIILPKDFTKLTGSDFDIDKLFISRLFINPETVSDENNMFTFFDNVDQSNKNELLKTLHKGFVNKLLLNYITLLMDKNSANTKQRPIDSDTELWKDVHRDLYPESNTPVESMLQDTIVYLTEQKNNFVVGKIGIGPYALNNNNHIYTMLYNISVRSSLFAPYGMNSLAKGSDIYGNSIMSWLSGGINAHVDIAKDPFVTKLNINKYTYNISNFLLRAGFGRNALWFLNQPVIKELAKRQNNITGLYLKATTKSLFDALKDVFELYKKELTEKIPEELLNKSINLDYKVYITKMDGSVEENSSLDVIQAALGRPLTVKDVLIDRVDILKTINFSDKLSLEQKQIARKGIEGIYQRDFVDKYALDMIEKDKDKSMIYNAAKYGDLSSMKESEFDSSIQQYMSVVIFDQINSNEAKTCSDIVKFTKIDTKKHGSTIAALLDYRIEYQKFIAGLLGKRPRVMGNTMDLFGISETDDADVLGSMSSINLHGNSGIINYTGLPGLSINYVSSNIDITEAGYVNYNRSDYSSFIHNKTRKAISALVSILRNESVESTYGFEYIWRAIKNDFGRSALTEDMLTKLRSIILGAIKSKWVFSKMKELGISPISLFKDTNDSFSLAHELYRMKTRSIRYTDQNHIDRRGEVKPRTIITTVAKVFKDNELLKILHDAHTKDDYSLTGKLIDILDFIKVHVPFTDDSKDSNKYIDAWRELYNNDLTKDFAVKLMFYSFIVSNDQGGSNLFKYVPFEMLLEYGLFDAERSMINRLNDLDFLYSYDKELLSLNVLDIIDTAETILCEDFDFSQPFHLETVEERQDKITGLTTKVPVLQYTGFGSKFGKKVVRNGETEGCERIPYVFIPTRINGYGTVSKSKTITVNRPYIRVYNPIRNYENEERYFIYKRIGQIVLNKYNIIPIYKLVNSSMYTLGQYKIYNYDNEMPISATEILETFKNYVLSEKYSISDINDFISNAVKQIKDTNAFRIGNTERMTTQMYESAIRPLTEIDHILEKLHELNETEIRVFSIRTNLLPKFKDGSFIEFYKNQHNTGKNGTVEDLNFVKQSNLFTEEEKSIAELMLTEINKFNEILELLKANKKQPNRQVDPRTYHMHSGGAFGADTMWAYYGQLYGIPDDPLHISHYYFGYKTPKGNVALTKEQFFEGLDKVFIADQTLSRFDNMSEERQKKIAPLLARNWMLVKNSDAIFAIGELKYGKVDGGTGWAVLMAIDAGKPVHVFNLPTELWFIWDTDKRTWVVEDTPKLTKNFAGIGTRAIDKDIEAKTANQKKPVKYVGNAKRLAAIDAINAVYRNTFGEPKLKPKSPEDFNGPNNPPENFNGPKRSLEVLESSNTILSNKELLKLKPYTGSDTHPRIAVASEHADPAFFAQQIVGLFDEGKPLVVKLMKTVKTGEKTADGKDKWERKEVETTYTADDFDALYIITKHDGLPLKKILQTKVPKLIHFSVTGMGGTDWEPGVMKYQDMLKRIKDFIKMGLDPEMVTMRIDPIIPGVTPFEVIEDIVKKSAAMGIKTIKFSVMDWYRSTAPEVAKNTGYDYSKYYEAVTDKDGNPLTYWWCPKDKDGKPIPGADGKPLWEKHVVYKPDARVEEQKKISDFMLSLKDKYGVTLQSCAEPLIQEGIEKVGCLSVPAINNMLGTHIEDLGADNNKQRALCTCYGGKTDLMAYNQNCASVCWYCYAHHQGDKILNYYNEDGTLKDNAWTRTGYEELPEDEVTKTVQDNGKIRLSLPSHTEEKPRQIVLEPQGNDKYYAHIRIWDGDHIPGKISNEDKLKLFNALYNELPDGAEILLPKSGEDYYATRGTIAALQRLSRDSRFTPGTKGIVKYKDKDGSIKEYEGTSFIKAPTKNIPQGGIKTINISSYEEETNSLSNFAIRPFETELAKGTPKMKMKSVEHAFLSSKAYFAWNAGDITDKQFWDFIKYINAREGKDVKSAGRAIPMSLTTIDEWNKVSDKVLEVMMLRSFLLNETAASQLLNTGNAEFTHNYKNGQPIEPKTPKRFGDLLKKVRSKLRDENNRKQECK